MQQSTVNFDWNELNTQFTNFINKLDFNHPVVSMLDRNVGYVVNSNSDITFLGKLDMLINSGYKIYCSFQGQYILSYNKYEKTIRYYTIKNPKLYLDNEIDIKTVYPLTYNFWKDQDTEDNYILPFLFSNSTSAEANKRIEVLEKIIWLDPNHQVQPQPSSVTPTPSITQSSYVTPTSSSIAQPSSVTPTPSITQSSSVTPTPSITQSSSVTPTPQIDQSLSSRHYLTVESLINKLASLHPIRCHCDLVPNYASLIKAKARETVQESFVGYYPDINDITIKELVHLINQLAELISDNYMSNFKSICDILEKLDKNKIFQVYRCRILGVTISDY